MYYSGIPITKENYFTLKDKMMSFDLIMFRGDDIISDTIADMSIKYPGNDISSCVSKTDELYTHAGLIIKPESLPEYGLDINKLYIFESTYSFEISGMNNGPPDSISNKPYFGAQLRDLEDVCKSYIRNEKTKISWFKLINYPQIHDFTAIFKKYHLRPFFVQNEKSLVSPLSMFDFTHLTPDILIIAKSMINTTLLQNIMKSSFSCVNLITSIYHDIDLISHHQIITYPIELIQLCKCSSTSVS